MTATAPAGRHDAVLRFVRAVSPQIHQIGGAWFFTPQVAAEGARVGIHDPFALYAAGRGGVLGDAVPSVVASCFAFFPAAVVTARYARAVAVAPATTCADAYAAGLAAWGRDTFVDLPGLARLAELARRVAAAADPIMGLPLFAGWRARRPPDDPAGAAATAVQVLRELRGDLHIHAVVAHGLTPLEAILGKDGPARARQLGYPEPYPDPAIYLDRRRRAEDRTDELVARAYATLDESERTEFRRLLDPLAQAVSRPATSAGSG